MRTLKRLIARLAALVSVLLIAPVVAAAATPLSADDADKAEAMVIALLRNMRDNGYNNCPGTRNGMYVNWRYGTNLLVVNFHEQQHGGRDTVLSARPAGRPPFLRNFLRCTRLRS